MWIEIEKSQVDQKWQLKSEQVVKPFSRQSIKGVCLGCKSGEKATFDNRV